MRVIHRVRFLYYYHNGSLRNTNEQGFINLNMKDVPDIDSAGDLVTECLSSKNIDILNITEYSDNDCHFFVAYFRTK